MFYQLKFFSCLVSVIFILFLSSIVYSLSNQPIQNKWLPHGFIYAAAEGPDGAVYLGGSILSVSYDASSATPIDLKQGNALVQFPKVNGQVRTIISDGRGGWYLGGEFEQVGEERIRNLVHILPNYSVDLKFQPNPDDGVSALVLTEDKNTLYIGGWFKTILDGNLKSQNISGLAKFDVSKTPTLVVNWHPNPYSTLPYWFPGLIRTLAVKGNTLYVGGSFDHIANQPMTGIARFKDGIFDAAWNPNIVPTGSDPLDVYVTAFAFENDMLYVGGQNLNNGKTKLAFIRLNKDVLDSVWTPPFASDKKVYSLLISGESLYVIEAISDNEAHLFRLKKGVLDSSWKPISITGSNFSLLASAFKPDVVYLGGSFLQTVLDDQGNKKQIYHLARIMNGVVDPHWEPLILDSPVNTLALSEDGNTLYVGGKSFSIGGNSVSGLIKLNQESEPDQSWNQDEIAGVKALLFDQDTLYVAGSSVLGLRRFKNGVPDLNWKEASFQNGQVYSLAMNEEMIYLAGDFVYFVKDANGKVRDFIYGLARLNKERSIDTSWKPNPTYFSKPDNVDEPASIQALAVDGDTVYVAGNFDKISDEKGVPQPIAYLARFKQGKLDTTSWHPEFKPIVIKGTELLSINAVAVMNHYLYVGGAFQVDVVQNLARFDLNNNGMLDTTWQPNPSNSDKINDPIKKLILEGNSLYTGGYFQTISNEKGQKDIRCLAKFDNGILDINWHPNRDCYVEGLVVVKDSLYVSGSSEDQSNCFFQFRSSVQFSKTEIKKERKSEAIDLEVVLSEPDNSPVTVDYSITGGTAKNRVDYEFNEGTLKFAPGETKKTISLKIKEKPKETNDLTIEISLSKPTGLFLGENKKLTYTIRKTFTSANNSTSDSASSDYSQQSSGGCTLIEINPKRDKITHFIFLISFCLIFLQRKRFSSFKQ